MSEMALKMLLFFAATSFPVLFLLKAGLDTRRDVRQRCERERAHATGTITGYERKSFPMGRRSRTVTFPMIEFTAGARTVRALYENGMDKSQFPEGTAVQVAYDPRDEAHFHLETDPVFVYAGSGAIRISIIWILISAALTVALAVFVGGESFDLSGVQRGIHRFYGRLR